MNFSIRLHLLIIFNIYSLSVHRFHGIGLSAFSSADSSGSGFYKAVKRTGVCYICCHIISTLCWNLEEMSSNEAGIELLKLFLLDLLGRTTPQAKILENKLNGSVISDKRLVSWGLKCVTMTMLVLFNLFCLYICLLYGLDKGQAWQRSWALNSAINFLVEIVFNQVTEVLILDFGIPYSISQATLDLKQEVRDVVSKMGLSAPRRTPR